ncbi:hypothetical protein D9M68_896660 [compost metagenome]
MSTTRCPAAATAAKLAQMKDLPTPGAGPLITTVRLLLPARANRNAVRKLRRLSMAGSSGFWSASSPPPDGSSDCCLLKGMVE